MPAVPLDFNKGGAALLSNTSQCERSDVLTMGSRPFVPIAALRKQRARKQGQATPHTQFPPKLFSFGQFGIERVSHRFARSFRFGNIAVVVALKFFQRVPVFRCSIQIPLRDISQIGAGFFLSVKSPLNLYFRQCRRRRPLQRSSDGYGSQANPAGEYNVGQKSMQTHSPHLCPTAMPWGLLTINFTMVRKEGFEPPRPFGHKILSLARLPVPPLPQWS